jgi:hypothetical protein
LLLRPRSVAVARSISRCPYAIDDTGTDPDVVSGAVYRLTLNYSDINNFPSAIPWAVSFIGNINSDNLLDDEKAAIIGWILDRNTQNAIGSNSSIAYMEGSGDGGGAGGMTSSDTVLTISDKLPLRSSPKAPRCSLSSGSSQMPSRT